MLDTLLKHLDMVRLSVGAMAIIAVMTGCTGLIEGKGSDNSLTPEQKTAQEKWLNEALPAFQHGTCVTCHQGQQPNVGFLIGDTDLAIRDTLLAYNPPSSGQVVNLDAPQSSRVLTKGVHEGPAMLADDASSILDWIQAEADADTGGGSGSTILETAPFQPLLCTSGTAGDPTCPYNHVDLTPVGLPGATITFVAQAIGNDSTYLTDLTFDTGTNPQGGYIEHPLFVSLPAMMDPLPDSIDRFFDVKLNEMPNTSTQLDGGLAAFTGFIPTDQMEITFKVVGPYVPQTGGTMPTGCTQLATFVSTVIPDMTQANACFTCHMGQNQNATSAMDITGINSGDMTMQQAACNQVRTRLNLQNIPQSGVLLAPDPNGDGAHPFKLSTTSNPTLAKFQADVTAWANKENTGM